MFDTLNLSVRSRGSVLAPVIAWEQVLVKVSVFGMGVAWEELFQVWVWVGVCVLGTCNVWEEMFQGWVVG